MKILVTGFDPFDGESVNPSLLTVRMLPDQIAGAQIIKLEIPTVFYKSLQVVEEAILSCDPDVILSVGQAGENASIAVERIGINLSDGRIPDNEGNQPKDEPIFPQGPAAYFVTLPVKSIVSRIRAEKIPAFVSNSAGTFVCNHVLYGVCHLLATRFPGKWSGFIHIPYLPEQTIERPSVPSMSKETVCRALYVSLETIVKEWEKRVDKSLL